MKKFKFLAASLAMLGAFALASCGSEDAKPSTGVDEDIYKIYELYKSNGGSLSYDEWLVSIKGEKGDTGAQGPQGEKGDKGEKGDTGAQGSQGDNGSSGLSAYQIYLKYHPEYTGSEEDWINEIYNHQSSNPVKEQLSYGVYKVKDDLAGESFIIVDGNHIYSYTTDKKNIKYADYLFICNQAYEPRFSYEAVFINGREIVVRFNYEVKNNGIIILDDGTLINYGEDWYMGSDMSGTLVHKFTAAEAQTKEVSSAEWANAFNYDNKYIIGISRYPLFIVDGKYYEHDPATGYASLTDYTLDTFNKEYLPLKNLYSNFEYKDGVYRAEKITVTLVYTMEFDYINVAFDSNGDLSYVLYGYNEMVGVIAFSSCAKDEVKICEHESLTYSNYTKSGCVINKTYSCDDCGQSVTIPTYAHVLSSVTKVDNNNVKGVCKNCGNEAIVNTEFYDGSLSELNLRSDWGYYRGYDGGYQEHFYNFKENTSLYIYYSDCYDTVSSIELNNNDLTVKYNANTQVYDVKHDCDSNYVDYWGGYPVILDLIKNKKYNFIPNYIPNYISSYMYDNDVYFTTYDTDIITDFFEMSIDELRNRYGNMNFDDLFATIIYRYENGVYYCPRLFIPKIGGDYYKFHWGNNREMYTNQEFNSKFESIVTLYNQMKKQAENDPNKNVTISMYFSGYSNESIFQSAIASFNKIYPNITVNLVDIGSYSDIQIKLISDMQSRTLPTISFCYDTAIPYISDYVVDIQDYISNPLYGFSGSKVSYSINESHLIKSHITTFGDDKTYTLPIYKSTEVLYYNETFFNEHSLKVPTTIDELWDICKKIKEIDPNSTPLGYDSESNFFYTLCEAYGYDYLSLRGDKILFNNSNVNDLMMNLKKYYDLGYFTTSMLYGSYTSNLLVNQNSYMSIGSSASARNQYSSRFTTGIAKLPFSVNGNQTKAISQEPSICLFKGDSDKELAGWLFIQYLLTPEFQAEFSKTTGYIPVNSKALDVEEYANYLNTSLNTNDTLQAKTNKYVLSNYTDYFIAPALSSNVINEISSMMVNILNDDVSNYANVEALVKKYIDIAEKNCVYFG